MPKHYPEHVAVSDQYPDDLTTIQQLRSAETLDAALLARNALVTKYLALTIVATNATVPAPLNHWRDDGRQEAACALIESAGRYDPSRGIPFARYAYTAMVYRIRSYLRVHRHAATAERLGRAAARVWALLRETNCDLADLADDQVARKTGLSVAKIRAVRPWLYSPLCLDASGPDGDTTGETIASLERPVTQQIEETDRHEQLHALLAHLSPKDRYLVTTVYGLDGDDPVSIRTAAGTLGLSAARGAFRVRRALKRIRAVWSD